MKSIICNFCQNKAYETIYTLKDFQLGLDGTFTLVRCTKCGLLYLNPQPTLDSLMNYYPDCYDSYTKKKTSSIVNTFGYTLKYYLITRYVKGGKLLDVGFGNGNFLKRMEQREGWDLYGIEPVTYPYNLSKRYLKKSTLYNCTLIDTNFENDYFDVITLWDVLEHVPNPLESLIESYRILKPGGYIFIQTPNPISWEAKLFGPFWRGLEAPRHLFLFVPAVLVNKLTDIGFIVLKVKGAFGNFSTALKSISYLLKSKNHHKLAKLLGGLSTSMGIRIASLPVVIPLRLLGKSYSYIYISRKPLE